MVALLSRRGIDTRLERLKLDLGFCLPIRLLGTTWLKPLLNAKSTLGTMLFGGSAVLSMMVNDRQISRFSLARPQSSLLRRRWISMANRVESQHSHCNLATIMTMLISTGLTDTAPGNSVGFRRHRFNEGESRKAMQQFVSGRNILSTHQRSRRYSWRISI